MESRCEAFGYQLELGIVATKNTLKLGIALPKREIIIDKFIRMGGQKYVWRDICPLSPPGSATGDKPNATTFIKPQLEFLIIKLCNSESVGGGNCPPFPPCGYATAYSIYSIIPLTGRKYSSTTKYPCIYCAIYQLNIHMGAKIETEIYRYQKFIVLALSWVEILYVLSFHEVLIINNIMS